MKKSPATPATARLSNAPLANMTSPAEAEEAVDMLATGAFERPSLTDGRRPEGRAVGVTVVPDVAAVAADFFKAIAPAKTSKS